MADYTFLVLEQTVAGDKTNKGEIIAVQQGDGEWGRKEDLPVFSRVSFSGTRDEMRWVFKHCRYDSTREVFRHKDTGDDYDASADVVLRVDDFSDATELDEALVNQLIPDHTQSACKHFTPAFVDEKMREYWWERWFPFRRMAGVRDLLETVQFGSFAHTRRALRRMEQTDRQEFLALMTQQERRYLRSVCVANTPAEYIEELG